MGGLAACSPWGCEESDTICLCPEQHLGCRGSRGHRPRPQSLNKCPYHQRMLVTGGSWWVLSTCPGSASSVKKKLGGTPPLPGAEALTCPTPRSLPNAWFVVFTWPPDHGNKMMVWAVLRRPSSCVLVSRTGEHFSSQANTCIFHFGHKCVPSLP